MPAPEDPGGPDRTTYDELVAKARQQADQAFTLAWEMAVVREADMAARGQYPVTVVHGDPEDDKSADLIFRRLPAAARESGQCPIRMGGNDFSTFVFDGPAAPQAAAIFIAKATEMAETWWRITPTATPLWQP